MIMLNIKLTKALIVESSSNQSGATNSYLPPLEKGYGYAKLFLGKAHMITRKFRIKIEAMKTSREAKLLSQRSGLDDSPKIPSMRSSDKGSNRSQTHSLYRAFESTELRANGQKSANRLASLLETNETNHQEDSISKETNDKLFKGLMQSGPNTHGKGFRIRRNSLSNLQPLTKLDFLVTDIC